MGVFLCARYPCTAVELDVLINLAPPPCRLKKPVLLFFAREAVVTHELASCASSLRDYWIATLRSDQVTPHTYRGTSLIRNTHPHRIAIGP